MAVRLKKPKPVSNWPSWEAEAIPALVALLPDEKLNLYARFGLEGILDPAVDAALRDAATKLQGRPQIGVINSIGQRRDAGAVELLKDCWHSQDAAVAGAAAGALGRIGTSEAAAVLRKAGEELGREERRRRCQSRLCRGPGCRGKKG